MIVGTRQGGKPPPVLSESLLGDKPVVVSWQTAELAKVITPRHRVLDVYGWPELKTLPGSYEGFCWSRVRSPGGGFPPGG